MSMKESDMYPIVEKYFRIQGYNVQGEVCGCDLVALKDNELVIVELKIHFNPKLMYQSVRRLSATDKVYACFLKPKARQKMSYWTMIKSLCRRLNIGAMIIEDQNIRVLHHPGSFTAKKSIIQKKRILEELNGRKVSKNIGGVTGKKLETAYLESAVKIAVILSKENSMSAKDLKLLGTSEKTYNILYQNHYGWFSKKEKGLYSLEPGTPSLIREKYPKIWLHYYDEVYK